LIEQATSGMEVLKRINRAGLTSKLVASVALLAMVTGAGAGAPVTVKRSE